MYYSPAVTSANCNNSAKVLSTLSANIPKSEDAVFTVSLQLCEFADTSSEAADKVAKEDAEKIEQAKKQSFSLRKDDFLEN